MTNLFGIAFLSAMLAIGYAYHLNITRSIDGDIAKLPLSLEEKEKEIDAMNVELDKMIKEG